MQDYVKGFIHDIKNSLAIVKGCLDPENQLDYQGGEINFVQMAFGQTLKALDLVQELEDDLNQIRRRVTSEPVTVAQVHALLDEFVGLYPKVKVRFDCTATGGIFTDIALLKRVIDNCIGNALVAGKAPWILLTCECDEDILMIHVKDGGVGMNRKQLTRLGLPFSTTGGGDGCRILIDLLTRAGGTIHWDSILDVGTCVSIAFKLD